jgi:hypothetical protein
VSFRGDQNYKIVRLEMEYVVALDATNEVLWLEQLACTFRQADPKWTPIVLSDSQGVVALAKNLVHHNVSKHIKVRQSFNWGLHD